MIAAIFAFVGLAASLECHAQAVPEAGADRALLRCDPGAQIRSIDGDSNRKVSNVGLADCAIALTPGAHAVRATFSWSDSDWLSENTWSANGEREVSVDAAGGHIYRLKFDFTSESWASIVDVTREEAGLPSFPAADSATIRSLPKERRTTTVVARISPERSFLMKLRGATDGIWFRESSSSAVLHRQMLRSQPAGAYILSTADAGENFVLDVAMFRKLGVWNACGDDVLPVFENTPGGAVLYLGEFGMEPRKGGGLRVAMSQTELEQARDWLRMKRPNLADELQRASFRLVRIPRPCLGGPSHSLEYVVRP